MVYCLTHWLLELFAKNVLFFGHLVVFGQDLGQISFSLVEKAFATQQFAFLATSIMFYDILAWAGAEIKILSFWTRKWPTPRSLGFDF